MSPIPSPETSSSSKLNNSDNTSSTFTTMIGSINNNSDVSGSDRITAMSSAAGGQAAVIINGGGRLNDNHSGDDNNDDEVGVVVSDGYDAAAATSHDREKSFQKFLEYINHNDTEGSGGANNSPQEEVIQLKDDNNTTKQQKQQPSFNDSRRSSTASMDTFRASNLKRHPNNNNNPNRSGGATNADESERSSITDGNINNTTDNLGIDMLEGSDKSSSHQYPQQQQQQQQHEIIMDGILLKSRLEQKRDNGGTDHDNEIENARSSLTLSDVFTAGGGAGGTTTVKRRQSSTGTQNSKESSNNNNSVSLGGGTDSDDGSSMLLDLSWGSTNYDKATVMSSLEEVMAANPHMKLETTATTTTTSLSKGGGERESNASNTTTVTTTSLSKGGGGGGGGESISVLKSSMNSIHSGIGGGSTRSGRSGSVNISLRSGDNGGGGGGGGSSTVGSKKSSQRGGSGSVGFSNSWGSKISGSNRSGGGGGRVAIMAPIAISHGENNDEGGATMIPPVFKTRRRSTDSSTTGGTAGLSGVDGASGGGGSGGGGGSSPPLRSRRPSFDAGVLRNSKSGTAQNDNNNMMGPIVHVDGGGDGGSGESFSKTLGFKGRSNNISAGNNGSSSKKGMSPFAGLGGGWRTNRRRSEDSMSSLGSTAIYGNSNPPPLSHRRAVELTSSSHELLDAAPDTNRRQGNNNKSSRSRLSQASNRTGSSVGVDDPDMDLSDENLQVNGSGSNRGRNDNDLVAAVGGNAYLKASKKVWCMRIIVIATFVVVSIIVTVLIYTFFRKLESNTLTNEFAMLAVALTRNSVELLERKAYSLDVLAHNYEGILGSQTTDLPLGDQAPGVMLSDQARVTCGEPLTSGNEWKTNFPYVTLPGYESYSKSMMTLSEDRAVLFAPVVPDEDVTIWEEYARNNALELTKRVVDGGIQTPSGDVVQYDVHESVASSSGSNHAHRTLRSLQNTHEHQDADSGTGMPMKNNANFTKEDTGALPIQVPTWQLAPFKLNEQGLMWDLYKHPPYTEAIDRVLQTESSSAATKIVPCNDLLIPFALTSPPTPKQHHSVVMEYEDGTKTSDYLNEEDHILHGHDNLPGEDEQLPYGVCSAFFAPVHNNDSHQHGSPFTRRLNTANATGVVGSIFSWEDVLKASANTVRRSTGRNFVAADVFVVVSSKLPDDFPFESYESAPATYYVTEHGAIFVGMGRNIQPQHASMGLTYDFSLPFCDVVFTYEVYPTDVLCSSYGISNTPTFLSLIAICFAVLSTLVFFIYDYFVNYRQKVIIQQAARSTRIVHSLYPAFVRDNLFRNEKSKNRKDSADDEFDESPLSSHNDSNNRRKLKLKVSDLVDTPANQLKRFLSHPIPSKNYDLNMVSELDIMDPIAEVFENTTVMIADIEGFTAWCSEREPSQVFRLLETVYRAFDVEGSKAGVFKVETVGDSYVAVTGLPDPREDHAVLIAKYAIKCLLKFNVLAKRLEPHLGPGTASLGMRFGLHSGPVTAGVLRGEKSRFQLFGDTINVASRMESTGEKNMIQVSQDTADLLTSAGKGHWLVPRDSPVSAKGKGLVHTYWLQPNKRRPSMNTQSMRLSNASSSSGIFHVSEGEEENEPITQVNRALSRSWKNINIENGVSIAKERLIRWNAAILETFLLKIIEQRNAKDGSDFMDSSANLNNFAPSEDDKLLSFSEKLSEKIMFPADSYSEEYPVVLVGTSISSQARAQLLEYVATIASMYRDVPFHNFDHASHVTMSANKLLNRVCTAFVRDDEDFASVAARTFGISADPLAQFVIVFSSLVHDVDHQGVPNAQLVKEHDPLCDQYDSRSVAEKRSIAVAWEILMEDRFLDLQAVIFTNNCEMVRFRQLLMNTVLATDIADKERSAAGKIRWQKAFHPSHSDLEGSERQEDAVNIRSLKATLVFEQIMQASDVSHTMQHWHTFKKWNKRLYSELSKAFREGRGASDPREKWYEGEIGFFDFYIIPLAKKLRECGVFGSAASEYLDYAVENRRRWEEEGREIANKMVNDHDALYLKDEVLEEENLEDLEEEKDDIDDMVENTSLGEFGESLGNISYNEDEEEVSVLGLDESRDRDRDVSRSSRLDESSQKGDEIV